MANKTWLTIYLKSEINSKVTNHCSTEMHFNDILVIDWAIDFNGMSNDPGLFYALILGNQVPSSFMFTFCSCSCFLRNCSFVSFFFQD